MILQFHVGGFDDNLSYLIVNERSHEGIVVDPAGDLTELHHAIRDRDLRLMGIVATHSHFDHVEGIPACKERYDAPVYIHENAPAQSFEAHSLKEGDTLPLSGMEVRVLHTPGHIADAICLLVPDDHALLTGDTLFIEGAGRTTKENARDLFLSLRRIKQLPDETTIYPGHDYGTEPYASLETEKARNRFLVASDYEAFLTERFG